MRTDVVWSSTFVARVVWMGLLWPVPALALGADGAGDVPQVFDRVLAVPKKQLLKRHRLELTPEVSFSVNDGFYAHFAAGGSAFYALHDAFGVGLMATSLYAHTKLAATDEMRLDYSSAMAALDWPKLVVQLGAVWTPLYGKVSLPGRGIAQFDMYAALGAGVATAFGVHNPPAVSVALGQHIVVNRWSAIRVEVRDILFLDRQRARGVARSSVQSYVLLSLGVSFYVPPSFEYSSR